MPNRIIKESAFESDKIAALNDFEFRLWVGLITQADDAGRGDARPAIIKGHVFVLRERVTVKDIESALHALAAAGCVSLYKVGGKPYYQFPGWAKHQRVREAKPKYPAPEDGEEIQLAATRRNSPQLAATRGEAPQSAALIQSNPIQSEYNPNPNTNARARSDALSVFGEFAKDDHELATALADFAQMRKTVKKPLTSRAAELICQKLVKEFRREDWIPVINQSVENSWQGLFPLKDEKGPMWASAPTGGASRRVRESNAQCQTHNEISAGMMAAARQMLEEEI